MSSKCSLFHNSDLFDSCIIHILYTWYILSVFFSLQNAVCFIILTCLVPVLFTFYMQVYFIYKVYTLRIFFSSKCSLFHNLTYLVPVLLTFYIQVCFIYMVYTLRICFSSKCSLFHNSNVFGSCIIHILYTVCAKI